MYHPPEAGVEPVVFFPKRSHFSELFVEMSIFYLSQDEFIICISLYV